MFNIMLGIKKAIDSTLDIPLLEPVGVNPKIVRAEDIPSKVMLNNEYRSKSIPIMNSITAVRATAITIKV